MTNMINQIGNLEMAIFGFGKKKEENLEGIKNATGTLYTRREILKQAGKAALAAGAAETITKAEQAKAKLIGGWEETVINGPTNLGDAAHNKTVWVSSRNDSIINGVNFENKIELPTILQSLIEDPIMEKIPGIPPGIHLAGKIYERAWLVRDDPEKLVKFIPEFDYTNEPASYLIAGYIYKNPQELATSTRFGNLPKNHAITHWAKEIGMYLNKYLRRENVGNNQIEDPAHQAMIISSGGQSIEEMTRNGVDLDKITNVKILIWATTWLVNHLNHKKKDYKSFYSNIEIPIRNKYPKLKIRGKPQYYCSTT